MDASARSSVREDRAKLSLESLARYSNVVLAGLALIAAAYLARAILLPICLGLVVAMLFLPAVARLERLGVPRWLSVTLLTVLAAGCIVALVVFLSLPFAYWVSRASELGTTLREKLNLLQQPLNVLNELKRALSGQTAGGGATISVETPSGSVIAEILAFMTPALGQTILFFGTLVFFLACYKDIKLNFVRAFPTRAARLRTLYVVSAIERSLTRYFGTFAVVNLGLGIATVAIAYIAALPNPLLWGVVAALLNFIPYVGPATVLATLFVVGLLTKPDLWQSFVAPAMFGLVTFVEGHFLTPAIIGRNLTLSPFSIFLAIAFWAWLWGPVGAFVAVPVLLAVKAAGRQADQQVQRGLR